MEQPKNVGTSEIALAISLIVGLQMLWAKIAEIRVNRENKGTLDKTTITGKEMDDQTAWRKDLIEQNKNLTNALMEAQKLIRDLQNQRQEDIEAALLRVEEAAAQIKAILLSPPSSSIPP
jgi:hypothetical protein